MQARSLRYGYLPLMRDYLPIETTLEGGLLREVPQQQLPYHSPFFIHTAPCDVGRHFVGQNNTQKLHSSRICRRLLIWLIQVLINHTANRGRISTSISWIVHLAVCQRFLEKWNAFFKGSIRENIKQVSKIKTKIFCGDIIFIFLCKNPLITFVTKYHYIYVVLILK